MSRFRRILHATDFSNASGAAFRWAVDMAKANHAELLLVHVINSAPLVGYGEYVPPQAYEEIAAYARVAGQKRLNALVAKAKRAGVRCKPLLLEGVAHERIVKAAHSKRADLIVIGTHGAAGIVNFLLGSVASRVVATAAYPVLTVRAK
jgi:nucleotide-binding universal stress UspA family protein